MRSLLDLLLGSGRSDEDRLWLLGNLEEDRRARLASGHGRFATPPGMRRRSVVQLDGDYATYWCTETAGRDAARGA